MSQFVKDLIIIILITIALTVAVIILLHFDFRFIAGIMCSPAALAYLAIYGICYDMYGEYKSKRDRARRDEEWRREQLVKEVMES